jgi:hypothetical protein
VAATAIPTPPVSSKIERFALTEIGFCVLRDFRRMEKTVGQAPKANS